MAPSWSGVGRIPPGVSAATGPRHRCQPRDVQPGAVVARPERAELDRTAPSAQFGHHRRAAPAAARSARTAMPSIYPVRKRPRRAASAAAPTSGVPDQLPVLGYRDCI